MADAGALHDSIQSIAAHVDGDMSERNVEE